MKVLSSPQMLQKNAGTHMHMHATLPSTIAPNLHSQSQNVQCVSITEIHAVAFADNICFQDIAQSHTHFSKR